MGLISKEVELEDKKIKIETGKLAKQADGATVVSCGGTSVLATIVAGEDVRPIDFLPLTVDFEEKLYAAGKIPGGFFKREGRPTDKATLTSRIIDRTIRPGFDKGFRNEVQAVVTVLSSDQVNPPDMLGLIGVAAAIRLSDIPYKTQLAGARVANIDGKWIINPSLQESAESSINIVLAGNKDANVMVEAGANEVSEQMILEALKVGHEAIKKIIGVIDDLCVEARQEAGRKPKDEILNGIFDYLTPRYKSTVGELIQANKSGDTALAAEAEEKMDQIAKDAAGEFSLGMRKLVGICSRIARKKELLSAVEQELREEAIAVMKPAMRESSADGLIKSERSVIRKDAKRRLFEKYTGMFPGRESEISDVLDGAQREVMRSQILEDDMRPDGRKSFQIRKLTCEVGLLPMTHGSAVFTRGETQVLTIATLGAYGEKQILDDLGIEDTKRYLHHYNFPPFCTGEARPMRGPKRREIGHGALAERALFPVVPSEEEFPYTIRLVSEVLESNGSSSMASVCASSMVLMDAGVPIKGGSHVGGIAMGMVLEGDDYRILSDIQGVEDAAGDMDFKVAGSKEGITALQMDIKCESVPIRILEEALEQAKQGRSFIIKAMTEAIPEPRSEVSPHAPGMVHIEIPVDKIGELIGPGGKNIRAIIEEYEVDIDVEDDGKVFIFGRNRDTVKEARSHIEKSMRELEVGEKFLGRVVKTTNFGAFVELTPGRDGLIHISKLSRKRIDRVEDVVNVGDKIEVEIESIDNMGKINLAAVDLPIK
ncbi:MAG: polyribonucleotide nucleotidyltransferase [Actinobacteria bacterium]|nr:polyribonucleotide nucleotidyltransferase [Actinomycetota bacterium]